MKHLYELKTGARFIYGGVEWVKLDASAGAITSLAAESVFTQAFDESNCNDFNKSTLRRELNGPFLDALVSEGADREAFLDFDSDLTSDDGMTDYMTDYGESMNKIALLSCDQYREYRGIIPQLDDWWWTLTPWTCNPEYSDNVRCVLSSGALNGSHAYLGYGGVRPLCNLKSDILVSIPGEESAHSPKKREESIEELRDVILNSLEDYPADIWGDALGKAVNFLLDAKNGGRDND